MAGVTKDQIERARQYDVLDYVLRYESDNVKRVGSGYRTRDHPSLEIKSGRWRWYSRGLTGRTALDYLTDVRGYGLVEAVCTLLGEQPAARSGKSKAKTPVNTIPPAAKPPPERLPFVIPRHHDNNNRVIAYLQSRGIDRDSIMDCIERGILYERAYFHDCVFKGKDENGKTQYAAIRSTTSDFKRDADGSVKKCSFLLTPDDPNSAAVAVFEAPIDALSHQTLCKQGFIPPFDGWRLSLGGTSESGLAYFLEHHPQVTHCLICTDDDEAGELAAAKIAGLAGITTERSLPVHGGDWNETLQAVQKAERTQNRARDGCNPCL